LKNLVYNEEKISQIKIPKGKITKKVEFIFLGLFSYYLRKLQ